MSTVREGEPGGAAVPIPALFAHLVDDTTLLLPRQLIPPVHDVLSRYLKTRDGHYGGMAGQLVCPVSRLPEVVSQLAKLSPSEPVDISLVVDTGLGSVPKALSLVLSRDSLLTPCTVETAAPPDVDSTWLERVSEFVPEDVLPVVEPRRPLEGDTAQWLDAVRRVSEHGCTPKLRCGGPRLSDVPSVDEVADFVAAADGAPAGFTTSLGVPHAVRRDDGNGRADHGMLNLLVGVARALVNGDVRGALSETDPKVLVREVARLSEAAGGAVRGLLARCGSGPAEEPAAELANLGLL
ncbi:MAG: hypothetical protein QOI50_6608 [Pseudonocardiales bacterium]|nr:hypothetical protein [Pseudonocardiales bacterium]MDT7568847.1 hypothetical protein [Pseudonocardiales bacterium]MDT7582930.1 hypothetical protein [Pseudonocardiales bacterium]MDT7607050.1 hypothetical protein [Pseudonocardiales bacterium]MDT7622347.1 hypothetical protein [Pseudonocardiales bacterium]